MSKKTLLFIIFFIALVFFPIVKIDAAQVYVGVQITATEPANSAGAPDTGKLWCLPIGTTMGIMNSPPSSYIDPVFPTLNPAITTSPTCPGSTIWSGLVELTSGANYTIRITPTYGSQFCSGYYDPYYSGLCYETWDVAGQNKNCTEVCAHYGQTVYSGDSCYTYFPADNKTYLETIKGSSCSSYLPGSYSYYSKTTNECWYYYGGSLCNWSDPNYVRVCACNFTFGGYNSFDFSFTP